MAKSVTVVGPTILNTAALTETELVAAGWTVPAGTRSILGVKISYTVNLVNDAVLPKVARVRVHSEDLKVEPCYIFAQGIGSHFTSGNGDQSPARYFPLNIACKGGEVIYFAGTQVVTTTTAGAMAVTVFFSDQSPSGGQYYYKTSAAVYAMPVTAALKTTDPTTYVVSGGKKITGVYGMVWGTIAAAATGIAGRFQLESPDFKTAFPVMWAVDRANSILSVGPVPIELCVADDLDIPISDTTNVTQSVYNLSTTTAGAFITGVQYQK